MLQTANPGIPAETWESLSIGGRDAQLLSLREGLWGPRMDAVAACPNCTELLDLNLSTRELLGQRGLPTNEAVTTSLGEYTLTFRLPTTGDLIALGQHGDLETLSARLLRSCVLAAFRQGVAVHPGELPPEIVGGIEDQMEEADPLANVQLSLCCPSCDHTWRAIFDILSYLWTEVEIWAWRMLADVHTLARAYGWSESDILELSPTRRQFYLNMVGA